MYGSFSRLKRFFELVEKAPFLFRPMQLVQRHIVLVELNVLIVHVFDLFLQRMDLFRR